MPEADPRLKLSFLGEAFSQGAVPVSVVATKLHALQQALYHAAASSSEHTGERRGLWYSPYRASTELTFAGAYHSDLAIEAAISSDPVLFEDSNLGLQAVDRLFDVAASVQDDRIDQLKLHPYDRDYLLRALEELMPNPGDQYQVQLENCLPQKHPTVTFDAAMRRRVRAYTARQESAYDSEDGLTLVGELVKIYMDAGDDKITVRYKRRDIDCFYSDAHRDQVANLIAGATVEVTGNPTLTDDGQVKQIYQLTSVEPLSMEPLRIARFKHGCRDYVLRRPVAVNVEYSDGLWIYHHPELNLWGYAQRREDALSHLSESFDYQFRDIAEEDEAKLDAAAGQLRDKLRQLVRQINEDQPHA